MLATGRRFPPAITPSLLTPLPSPAAEPATRPTQVARGIPETKPPAPIGLVHAGPCLCVVLLEPLFDRSPLPCQSLVLRLDIRQMAKRDSRLHPAPVSASLASTHMNLARITDLRDVWSTQRRGRRHLRPSLSQSLSLSHSPHAPRASYLHREQSGKHRSRHRHRASAGLDVSRSSAANILATCSPTPASRHVEARSHSTSGSRHGGRRLVVHLGVGGWRRRDPPRPHDTGPILATCTAPPSRTPPAPPRLLDHSHTTCPHTHTHTQAVAPAPPHRHSSFGPPGLKLAIYLPVLGLSHAHTAPRPPSNTRRGSR